MALCVILSIKLRALSIILMLSLLINTIIYQYYVRILITVITHSQSQHYVPKTWYRIMLVLVGVVHKHDAILHHHVTIIAYLLRISIV